MMVFGMETLLHNERIVAWLKLKVKVQKLKVICYNTLMKITAVAKDQFQIKSEKVDLEIQNGKVIIKGVESKEFVIDAPGEFEVAQVAVFGLSPGPIYQIELEETTLVYLNSQTKLTNEQKEIVEKADVLLVNSKAKDVLPEVGFSEIAPVSEYQMKSVRDLPEETVVVGVIN